MAGQSTLGVRPSIGALQAQYDAGDKKPLEDVVRAWKGIKDLPPDDPKSFFMLGGFHGEPFLLRAEVDKLDQTDIYTYWGGYCNHGNVLFPTWHRVYVLKLEEALQSIVPGVMMPYWDETDESSLTGGIPSCLTAETFMLDGEEIPNPLKSFVLPEEIPDDYWGDNTGGQHSTYFKPKGYETVRYPLSGLVDNPEDKAKTDAHNAQFTDPAKRTALLNENVITWLTHGSPTPTDPDPRDKTSIRAMFADCLHAPNYTVFSNTTSGQAWNNAGNPRAVPLEQPHNDIHLSVGGFDLPGFGASGQVAGANGDMGENNTAGLDPIFFFHHCNVDRMFWLWQKHNDAVNEIEIIAGYAGTDSSDSQGPTPGIPPGTHLTLDTALNPFTLPDGSGPYTSRDCVNIETQLGYTYAPGSLDDAPMPAAIPAGHSTKELVVSGMNRAHFSGSFVVLAYADVPREGDPKTVDTVLLGHHAVLSRWNVGGCANCQTHLEVIARFPLAMLTEGEVERAQFRAAFSHRGADLHPAMTLSTEVQG